MSETRLLICMKGIQINREIKRKHKVKFSGLIALTRSIHDALGMLYI